MSIQAHHISNLIETCNEACILILESSSETVIHSYKELKAIAKRAGRVNLELHVWTWDKGQFAPQRFRVSSKNGLFYARNIMTNRSFSSGLDAPHTLIESILNSRVTTQTSSTQQRLILDEPYLRVSIDSHDAVFCEFKTELSEQEKSHIQSFVALSYAQFGEDMSGPHCLPFIRSLATKKHIKHC